MSRTVHTTFTLEKIQATGARIGTIHFGDNGRIETPALFPAICIMTGPPGFGRQGSHYKYIKRAMCREWRHTHFLTEILHFTDYMATKTSLDRWLKKSFQTWMDEMMVGGKQTAEDNQGEDFDYARSAKPYEACYFLDSGGFKLLSNSDFTIEKFGYRTVASRALKAYGKGLLLPSSPREQTSKEFLRWENVNELRDHVERCNGNKNGGHAVIAM